MNNSNKPGFNHNQNPIVVILIFLFVVLMLFVIPFVKSLELIQKVALSIGLLIILVSMLINFPRILNSWMTRQENLKLRDIDINILAVERNHAYLKKDPDLSKKLFSLIGEIKDVEESFNNFIVAKEGNGQYFFFEYSPEIFGVQNLTSSKNMRVNNAAGIGVEYQFYTVPEFLLIHRSIEKNIHLQQVDFSNPNFGGYLHPLPENCFPDELSPANFLCLCSKRDQSAVAQLLEDHPALVHSINNHLVYIISFKQNLACAFLRKNVNADGSNIDTKVEFALQLLNISGNEIEASEKGLDLV